MISKLVRILFKMILYMLILAAAALFVPRLVASATAARFIRPAEDTAPAPVAVVLGAGLQRSGVPSVILRDRLDTAVALYQAGKVRKLLMSGDNSYLDYNEPGAMKAYAISQGVPEADIVLDYAGRRTYDTCYRALHIFQVQKAILVTQHFHLVRAVFTCRVLGLEAAGVASDPRRYNPYWLMREFPATSVAFWELFISHPLPILGNVEPIFPGGVPQ